MKGVKMANLTWEEAEKAMKNYSIVMLPVGGGTKEHGYHLPCGTDLMIVEELAARVVESAPVICLPTVPYAYYPAFVDWPGSISVQAQNFIAYVGDIIKSIAKQGIKKFLILDGGVSTQAPLKILSSDLHNELGVYVAVTNIEGIGKEIKAELCKQERGGHADEAETSSMLFINETLVQMDKAVEEYRKGILETTGATGVDKISMGRKVTTESGVHGNATLATVEKGNKILTAQAADIIYFIEHFQSL